MAIKYLPNHDMGHCFNPYNTFFNLHTSKLWKPDLKPEGDSIYTSSFKSSCSNALLTSKWWNSQFWFTTMENRTMMVSTLATEENVYVQTISYVWVYLLATNLTLYYSIDLSARCFMVKTHRYPTALFSCGRTHFSQLLVFSYTSISIFIYGYHSRFFMVSSERRQKK